MVEPPGALTTARAPQVSVVVVTWNSCGDTLRTIEAVLGAASGVELELIVVDNNSSDGSARAISRAQPSVKVIANDANVGFARACNQGMAASRGRYILLLNSDAVVSSGVLANSVRWLEDHPEIGMVGCEVRTETGRRVHTANRGLSIRRSLFQNLWLYKLLPSDRRALSLLGGYWEGDEAIDVDWLAGAFLFLRRELFDRSGGFDPRFFMYGEDSEWCMRLRRMGFRIAFVPALGIVTHTGAASSIGLWGQKERLRRGHVGGLRAYAMLNGDARARMYRWAQLVGYAVRWCVYRTALQLRPSAYVGMQEREHRWLCEIYIRPSREYGSADPADRGDRSASNAR